MLNWLGDLVQAALRFVPRIMIVRSTHRGVAFVRGKNVRVINPGLYIYWPLITECIVCVVVRQSIDLPTQILTTKDGLSVVVSGVVIYAISDIEVALTEQWDHDETIRVLSQAAIRNVVCSQDCAYLNQNRTQVENRLKTALSRELSPYGVSIIDSKLTDLARANVLALAGNGNGANITPVTNLDGADAGSD